MYPMLTYRYVDDGWFCQGWWIEESNGTRFAEAREERAAMEICAAVNTARETAALNKIKRDIVLEAVKASDKKACPGCFGSCVVWEDPGSPKPPCPDCDGTGVV